MRNPASAADLLAEDVTLIPGNLNDRCALDRLVDGAEIVIHLAGRVRGRSAEDFDSINVDGARHLAQAIAGASTIRQVINLSSVVAREPTLSYYSASKRNAEITLAEHLPDQTVLNLRAPAVYGPGDREILPLLKAMALGIAPLAGPAESRLSLIHVDDLVTAILAGMETGTGGVYEIDDGRPGGYDWLQLAQIVESLIGRRVRLLSIPPSILDSVAWLNRSCAGMMGHLPMLTKEKLRELRHPDWVCDSTSFQAITSWRPTMQFYDGLLHTPGWR